MAEVVALKHTVVLDIQVRVMAVLVWAALVITTAAMVPVTTTAAMPATILAVVVLAHMDKLATADPAL